MFNNTSTSNVTLTPQPVLPYAKEFDKFVFILKHIWPAIFLFGIMSNSANILVFLKSGVKDNVTVLLLCLSVSDLCFLALMTPWLSTAMILTFAPDWQWQFDLGITAFLFYWPAYTLYAFSAYVSVFLGVTRCACVAMPLQFKSVFTMRRTILAVVAIFTTTILLHTPVLTIHSIGSKLNLLTNRSFAYLETHGRSTKAMINDSLNRTFLPWTNFIIMVACVIILIYKLFQASRIRTSATNRPTGLGTASNSGADKPLDNSNNSNNNNNNIGHNLSGKDIQVVQQVVLVCVIFILSQLPFLLNSTGRLVYPEFNHYKKYHHLFGICSKVSSTCSFLNASVNIFIYYKYNTRYRTVAREMFRARCTGSKLSG
ncbi:chemosensory receptor C [Elysia marginata]|uniref:Chemosensory receptor C n=1 Tax=Elysia marginata TaxID=1093978 RepID=A0AAV4HRU9_9GAST|nr:chemosensory receptor C [Elysia marginata]